MTVAHLRMVGLLESGRNTVRRGSCVPPGNPVWLVCVQADNGPCLWQAALNPRNTVHDAKRLIGRKFTDPSVQEDMKHWCAQRLT